MAWLIDEEAVVAVTRCRLGEGALGVGHLTAGAEHRAQGVPVGGRRGIERRRLAHHPRRIAKTVLVAIDLSQLDLRQRVGRRNRDQRLECRRRAWRIIQGDPALAQSAPRIRVAALLRHGLLVLRGGLLRASKRSIGAAQVVAELEAVRAALPQGAEERQRVRCASLPQRQQPLQHLVGERPGTRRGDPSDPRRRPVGPSDPPGET